MLLKTLIVISLILLVASIYFWIEVRPRFGSIPKEEYLNRIASSPNYDRNSGKFVNTQEELIVEAEKNADNWKITREFLFPKSKGRQNKNCQK